MLERLEACPCLPMLPAELLYYCYPAYIPCPNPQCMNSFDYVMRSESDPLAWSVQSPEKQRWQKVPPHVQSP